MSQSTGFSLLCASTILFVFCRPANIEVSCATIRIRFTLRARYYVVASKRRKMFVLLLPLRLDWWTRCIWLMVQRICKQNIDIDQHSKFGKKFFLCFAMRVLVMTWSNERNKILAFYFNCRVLLFVGFYGHLHLLLITEATSALNARITSIDCNKFCVANACMQVCLIVERDLIDKCALCNAIATIDYRNDKVMVVVSIRTNVLPIRLTSTIN